MCIVDLEENIIALNLESIFEHCQVQAVFTSWSLGEVND